MNPGRWERIEQICWAALDQAPEAREAFLERECGMDADLRHEVEGLLLELAARPEFLEQPVVRLPELADAESVDTTRHYIGSYRLVRELGRGGMGEVHLAMREGADFEVTVAIKVIKRGMDTDEVLQRFRLERQMLASLHHPNIAQLMDGGVTTDGRPYFVMEYVEGTPITEYCDRAQLPVPQRLRLFQLICAAVQHAHQKLIVHRDLKPGNILVTPEGIPKLLDFGIGKVLATNPTLEHLPTTRADVRLLTPGYAAPEQVRGESPTTETDVYGLGVLLFEMLTGRRPFEGHRESQPEIARAICEDAPSRPSAIAGRRELAGDLDNIILKALSKERERRYPSAAAFSEDVGRYLDGQPIAARPSTLTYRTSRFLRRHVWGVAVASIAAVSIIGFAVMALVQSRRAAEERDMAREVSSFLLETFGATGADRAAGDTVTARQLLDRQAEALRTTYANRPELQAQMMHVVAEGYERLNLLDDSERLAREALAIRRRVLGDRDPDVAASLNLLGWVRQSAGHSDEAKDLLEESVAIFRGAGRAERGRLSRALNDLGIVFDAFGEHDASLVLFEEALEYRRATFGPNHRSVGITANNLAAALYRQGDYAGAVTAGQEAVAALGASVGPDHQRTIQAQSNLAVFHLVLGDLDGAERTYVDLLERQTRLSGPDNPVRANVLSNLGGVYMQRGNWVQAESALVEAIRIEELTLGTSHPELATSLSKLGSVRLTLYGPDSAIPVLERSLDILRNAYGDTHREMGSPLLHLGRAHREAGDHELWERFHREAVDVFERSLGSEHPRTAAARTQLGKTLLERGKAEEALVLVMEAHGYVVSAMPPEHALVHQSRLVMARIQLSLGDTVTADSLIGASRPGIEAGQGDENARQLLEELTSGR